MMHLPQLRRRFIWPADDLVTMNVSVDKAIDVALWWIPGHRPMVRFRDLDPTATVSVLGFPRSANSLLTVWMNRVVRPGVTVLDGRSSHSVLDLTRQVDVGIPVVVPVREPVDACASMLVRQARHDSSDSARGMLRAYAAWYTIAGRLLARPNMIVAAFGDVTADPATLAKRRGLRGVVDLDAADRLDAATLMQSAREELSKVVGQGLPKDGIPAHYLISLPEPARAGELDRARSLLLAPSLASERARATAVYETFLAASHSG
jgi:hypothetical protein